MGVTAERPHSIVSRFLARAARVPEREAYRLYPTGAMKPLGTLTWGDWVAGARSVAGALLAHKAQTGDRIAVFANNRALWPIAHLGAAMVGVVTVGISPGIDATQLEAILLDADPSFVVVDTLARLKSVRAAQITTRQAFMILCDDLDPLRSSTAEGLFEWERWCDEGASALNSYPALRATLTARLDAIAPDDVLVLDYNNDFVAGAELSHANASASTETLCQLLSLSDEDSTVVFQSCADAMGRTLAIYALVECGWSASLIESANEVFAAAEREHPTVFVGTQWAFEKLSDASDTAAKTGGSARAAVASLLGERCRIAVLTGEGFPHRITGALRRAGIELLSLYGKPAHLCICAGAPRDFDNVSIGKIIRGNVVSIGAFDELLVQRNAQTARAFYNRPMDTFQAFTSDGAHYRTGDIGSVAIDGTVQLMGRVGALVTLRTGAKVDVSQIELALQQTPLVEYAVCFGEAQDYVVAVLSLRQSAVEKWAHAQGLVAPWTALVQHHLVRDELARAVASVNAARLGSAQVRKFAVTDGEFAVATGELSAGHTLVREVVDAQFRHIVDELYAS